MKNPIKIVIAPSGFKGSLDSAAVASCIARGLKRVFPDANCVEVPMADGGEGFAQTLVNATGGELHQVEVCGPVGDPVEAHFGILGGAEKRTAVLEMAAAAGLTLVPRESRDPLQTTTYGVGELIKAALDAGAERIVVGCGDSGTNDAGIGAAQALGVRLLDEAGNELERGGQSLEKLASIDLSNRDPRLDDVPVDVALNWQNVLCGEHGVARVFGPQKGADEATVARLESALEHFADVVEEELGLDVREMNGGGASGGLGAGLYALMGAKLHPRFEIVMQYLDLESHLEGADLVISAEGALDSQTPHGKVPVEVAHRARKHGVPVLVLAGTLGPDVDVNYQHDVDAFQSILDKPRELESAVEEACPLLTNSAEHAARVLKIGWQMRRD